MGTGSACSWVTITVTPRIDAPYFATAPVISGTALEPYSYHIVAQEPDGETFTLQAGAFPGWLTFTTHPDGSATLAGVPELENIGAHAVILKVTDASGKYAEQSFAIAVSSGKVFDLEPGWNFNDWFEDFYISAKIWIYHPDHGWLFPAENLGAKEDGIWFWSESLGWHWTREDVYPHLYLRRRQRSDQDVYRTDDLIASFGWFFYKPKSRTPRIFFDYEMNDWMPESLFALAQRILGLLVSRDVSDEPHVARPAVDLGFRRVDVGVDDAAVLPQ